MLTIRSHKYKVMVTVMTTILLFSSMVYFSSPTKVRQDSEQGISVEVPVGEDHKVVSTVSFDASGQQRIYVADFTNANGDTGVGQVYAYDQNKNFLWKSNITHNGYVHRIVANDVNGDGIEEILVAISMYGLVILNSQDGSIIAATDVGMIGYTYIYHLLVNDIDGDGKKEIFMNTISTANQNDGALYVFNSTGALILKYHPAPYEDPSRSGAISVFIKDVNGDSKDEVILLYGNMPFGNYGAQPAAYVVDMSNITSPIILYSWRLSLTGITGSQLVQESDGNWYVVFGGWGPSSVYKVHLQNGSTVWTFSVSSGADRNLYYVGSVPGYSGDYYIAFGSAYSDSTTYLYLVNASDASTVWTSSLGSNRGWEFNAVSDYDGDGEVELLMQVGVSNLPKDAVIVTLRNGTIEGRLSGASPAMSAQYIWKDNYRYLPSTLDLDGDDVTDLVVYYNSTHVAKYVDGIYSDFIPISLPDPYRRFVMYVSNPTSSVTPASDSTSYIQGERIHLTGTISPASSGQSVTFEVRYPNGSLHSAWTNTTNATGVAEYSFLLSSSAPAGTYTFYTTWSGITSSSSFLVNLAPPSITSPSDVSYEYGSSGNTISWIGTSSSPDTYVLTRDGVTVNTGTWNSGTALTFSIDGLALGSYTYELTLNDTSNNVVSDLVTVTVSDTTGPTVTSPSDISYYYGTTSNVISWTGTDLLPDKYVVTIDGVEHTSGTWSSGVSIDVNVDGLSLGTHNVVITLNDTSNNAVSDTVVVTVLDPSPVVNSPADVTYYVGDTGNTITWTATDNNPATYSVTMNGSSYASGSWSSGSGISINIDGLSEGVYVFEITVVDANSNSAVDSVLVTVRPTDVVLITSMTISGSLTPGGQITVDVLISNYYSVDLDITFILQILDSNGLPLSPIVLVQTIPARSDGNLVSFSLTIPSSSPTGNYSIETIAMTSLPSSGGSLYVYAEDRFNVV